MGSMSPKRSDLAMSMLGTNAGERSMGDADCTPPPSPSPLAPARATRDGLLSQQRAEQLLPAALAFLLEIVEALREPGVDVVAGGDRGGGSRLRHRAGRGGRRRRR